MSKESVNIEPSGFATMAESMEFADNYNRWIVDVFSAYRGKRVLEIGTGQGNFKKYFLKDVELYVSVDIDKEVIRRASLRDPDGLYQVADIADNAFAAQLGVYQVDTILCVNVLEHVSDHQKAFDNLMSVLTPGGSLLLLVPAFMHLYNDLDKLAGHHRRYTKAMGIALSLSNKNCEIVGMEYFNPLSAAGWWMNKFVSHKNINSSNVNSQVKLFDKYLMPVSRMLNPFFKRFWGQSLIAVYKRKMI